MSNSTIDEGEHLMLAGSLQPFGGVIARDAETIARVILERDVELFECEAIEAVLRDRFGGIVARDAGKIVARAGEAIRRAARYKEPFTIGEIVQWEDRGETKRGNVHQDIGDPRVVLVRALKRIVPIEREKLLRASDALDGFVPLGYA